MAKEIYYSFDVASIVKMVVLKTEEITWLLKHVPVVTYGGVQHCTLQ